MKEFEVPKEMDREATPEEKAMLSNLMEAAAADTDRLATQEEIDYAIEVLAGTGDEESAELFAKTKASNTISVKDIVRLFKGSKGHWPESRRDV